MEQQESEAVEKLSEKLKSTSANLGGRRETFEWLKQILDDYISDKESLVGTSIRNGKVRAERCDIGSEAHYIRAIDTRGRELSKGVFECAP